jgi:hypothetical protein
MLVHTPLICGAAASRAMRTHFIEFARHCIAESMDHTLPYMESGTVKGMSSDFKLYHYRHCRRLCG